MSSKYIKYKGSIYKMVDESRYFLVNYIEDKAREILDAKNLGVKMDMRSASLKVSLNSRPQNGVWNFHIVSNSFVEEDIVKQTTKKVLEKAASNIKAKFQASFSRIHDKMTDWRLSIKTTQGELPRLIINFVVVEPE